MKPLCLINSLIFSLLITPVSWGNESIRHLSQQALELNTPMFVIYTVKGDDDWHLLRKILIEYGFKDGVKFLDDNHKDTVVEVILNKRAKVLQLRSSVELGLTPQQLDDIEQKLILP